MTEYWYCSACRRPVYGADEIVDNLFARHGPCGSLLKRSRTITQLGAATMGQLEDDVTLGFDGTQGEDETALDAT